MTSSGVIARWLGGDFAPGRRASNKRHDAVGSAICARLVLFSFSFFFFPFRPVLRYLSPDCYDGWYNGRGEKRVRSRGVVYLAADIAGSRGWLQAFAGGQAEKRQREPGLGTDRPGYSLDREIRMSALLVIQE
jgi:hypothetical protein